PVKKMIPRSYGYVLPDDSFVPMESCKTVKSHVSAGKLLLVWCDLSYNILDFAGTLPDLGVPA
ncbi:MAG TPA: hypothetical protein DEP57_02545, partial [Selenomonas sp.]|nr:hypothetical protein [Selenomonas sp.]